MEERNASVSIPHLQSLNELDRSLTKTPDFKYFLSYDFYRMDNPYFHKPNVYGFHNGKYLLFKNIQSNNKEGKVMSISEANM